MSYLFYPIFGGAIAIIVGSLISLVSEETAENGVNPMLFAPFVRRFLNGRVSLKEDQRRCVSHAFDAKDTQL